MIPVLYPHEEKEFLNNGIGRLYDCVSCKVTEERNGIFECEFQYPITGDRYDDIQEGRIIYVIHDNSKKPQPFEIYMRSSVMSGIATFYAHHISYRLGNVILKPFTASSCAQVFAVMNENSINNNPFTFWTDKQVTGDFKVEFPVSVKEILGGTEGSILDVYGKADYEWDKWTVKLHSNRGRDTDFEIRYGKNLTDILQVRDSSGVYTAVAPFWKDSETGETVYLPEGILIADEVPAMVSQITDHNGATITTETGEPIEAAQLSIQPVTLDLSEKFEEKPTEQQLRDRAKSLLNKSNSWVPDENIEVNFIPLWETEEYKDVVPLQYVSLCDKVNVVYPQMGINAIKEEVIKVEYDVLAERYISMELGTPKVSFSDVVKASTEDAILKNVPSSSMMRAAIENATRLISGGMGGHVVIGTNADGEPNEILIMDTDNKNTAVNVWRFNANGWGYSRTGYNGEYSTAATIDGGFVADFITTGLLNANLMRTGIITDKEGKNYWNLDTGEISISLQPGEIGAVTTADLARVENNAKKYANDAEKNAKDYVDTSLMDYATNESVEGKIQANNEGLTTEFTGLFAPKDETISQTVTYWYQSTSPTQLFGGTWTTDTIAWVDGMYIWQKVRSIKVDGTYTENQPVCITGNTGVGLPGSDGKDAIYLWASTNKSTSVAKENTSTVTFTGHVAQGDETDIDPNGYKYEYAWFKSKDDSNDLFYKRGKNITATIDKDFCNDRASLSFELVEKEFFYLTDHKGNAITDHKGNNLEVA